VSSLPLGIAMTTPRFLLMSTLMFELSPISG
jgi:hypothetical protein